jgi:hypothetical protein
MGSTGGRLGTPLVRAPVQEFLQHDFPKPAGEQVMWLLEGGYRRSLLAAARQRTVAGGGETAEGLLLEHLAGVRFSSDGRAQYVRSSTSSRSSSVEPSAVRQLRARPADTPTMKLYKAILKQYGSSVSGGVGSFSEMGFTAGEITVHALQGVKGPYGELQQARGCTPIRGSDPLIGAYRRVAG